jgi:hypothetical protein
VLPVTAFSWVGLQPMIHYGQYYYFVLAATPAVRCAHLSF